MTTKTGGLGTVWVVLERPKPVRVDNPDRYWGNPPPEGSARCAYWLRQVERGWRPNKYIRRHCRQCAAGWFGVYIWEYRHVLEPAIYGGDE